MPASRLRTDPGLPAPIHEGLEALRQRLEIPDAFPDAVLAEADQVAREGYDTSLGHRDLTDAPFVTLDPEGSTDLDQAMFLERRDQGYRVQYAIADVAAWVRPDVAIDVEARRRGQTYYAPHQRTPLHPPVLSESAASLLADGTPRPAVVWQIDLDSDGQVVDTVVQRALVRSQAKLNYVDVQRDIDQQRAHPSLALLPEIGELRRRIESERGGVSLNLPDQEVWVDESGAWVLDYRTNLPDEDDNSQISLLTGYQAARIELDGGSGLLRTLPPASPQTIAALRTVAQSLHLTWPTDQGYAGFVQGLDPVRPDDHAMLMACIRLFRGAGYTVITPDLQPDQTVHGALAEHYTHATAPLRRLVDRYVSETCLALTAGREVPAWVSERLGELPGIMNDSDRRAKAYDRGITDLVEALVLQPMVGRCFDGVIIDHADGRPAVVSIQNPAVEAPVTGPGLDLGAQVRVRLESVDLVAGKVVFSSQTSANAGQSR